MEEVSHIEIGMGQVYVAKSPATISTGGIGSCIAVCLYNPEAKVGGLAHVMLPARNRTDDASTSQDARYADVAIAQVLNQIERLIGSNHRTIAKIVGGANMFPDIQGRSVKMGERNAESVKEILSNYNIPLAAEEIGGSAGRAVTFDISNGIVTVYMTI